MTTRALCGGAHACRNRPSLSLDPRLRTGVSLLNFNLATTSKPLFSGWASLHVLRNVPQRRQAMTSNEAAHCQARHWTADRVRRTRLYSNATSTSHSRVAIWSGTGPRRCFSRTTQYFQERNKTYDKDRTPSRPAAPELPQAKQPRGIRKVIPKVLPSLTPHENIYTVPNILTFSRLVAAPFIGYCIVHDAHAWALGLFAYAGISDLLDGWIARQWKLQTVVGSVVDPMADKILMTVLTVSLAYQGGLPVWLAAIILGRDVGLGIAAIYYRWISLPPPKTFSRYWDFSLPSAEVRPTTISKYNTFLQLGLMGGTMVTPLISADVSTAMTAFQYLVAATTVWSGLSYVFSKDAVRILSQKDKRKK
ncbi:CDP-alcohol phosphatidyltransferase-domain-containing protein [Hypoxylon fuscum]|nr:CDP-alcohol phosphatidyltransferase-domain-containing protein [Hypoxylon fuscum]